MAASNTILALYSSAPRIHFPTALAARIALAAILYLVHTGNRRPGQRLLTATLAVLMFSAFIVSVSRMLTPAPGATDLVPLVATISLASAIGLAWGAVQQEGLWTVLPPPSPRQPWQRPLANLILLLAFYFPFFGTGILASLWSSPIGVLPHQVLLAGLVLVWASGANAPRLPAWTLCSAALLLGLVDLLAASTWQGIPGLLFAAFVATQLYRLGSRGGVMNDDEPDVDRVIRQRRAARDELKEQTHKVWKIK